MNKEQKTTTDAKVPNKDLETLKTYFPHFFDKNSNFDFEKFKNYLIEKKINFSNESYSLDWLGKSYARLLANDPATTLLKEDETHNVLPENVNPENLLIKGDNLEVLKHLANAYYEKIKMIYIDPPYNTGNDGFVYNDDRKYTAKELQNLIGIDEEKAKRILDFTKSKSNSHSAWLTFMYPRLYIARQLLKDDGVIFVSIDDNEVAQLRLLMDEIFGEENFIGKFAWRKKVGAGADSKLFFRQQEYIYLYAKNIDKLDRLFQPLNERQLKEYSNPDNDPRGPWAPTDLSAPAHDNDPKRIYKVVSPSGKEFEKCWAYTKENFQKLVEENLIWWGSDSNSMPKRKRFLKDKKGLSPRSWIDDILTKDGKKDLEIINFNYFEYPKPVKLIYRFLEIGTASNDLILDFFAGSGTTGDAVMQLNAENGGNRKFILVQLPEPIDPVKNKTAYDFVKNELNAEPTIFEITKERLLRAAKKINAELDERIEKLKNEPQTEETHAEIEKLERIKKQNSFKIFETIPIWKDYNFEAEQFDSSQTLFDAGKLTESDIKALLLTWKTYDGIILTQELESVDLSGYTTYYGNGKLYLMHKGFATDSLKSLLEKIDTDKHFEPKSIIAFGYNFESARLREISENVKTYNNRKKSDIEFVIRY